VRTSWSPRQQIALEHIDPTGRGLEIGPAFQPLAPKSMGFNVTILDHAPTEEIRQKYADLGLDQPHVDLVEEVDCVWTGGSYREAAGLKPPFDYIVAAHVIEHTTDPIGFLLDLDGLLAPSGRIALVIPDKRYTYDHHRPISTPGAMLDAHLVPPNPRLPGVVFDHFLHHVTRGSDIVWEEITPPAEFRATYTLEQAIAEARAAMESDAYIDVHRWVFTPDSFQYAFESLGEWLDGLRMVGSHSTAGCEFFVTLGRDTA
jgi:Methyltransferase domain